MEDRRKFNRVPFQCDCQIRSGERTWPGELLDISLRGALFQIPETTSLAFGDKCHLDISLSDGSIHLQFESEVAHKEEDQHGFRFISENLETLTHLRRLLELNLGEDDIMKKEIGYWLDG